MPLSIRETKYSYQRAVIDIGIRSMAYLWFATYIIGTPGMRLIRRFKSRSFVATM